MRTVRMIGISQLIFRNILTVSKVYNSTTLHETTTLPLTNKEDSCCIVQASEFKVERLVGIIGSKHYKPNIRLQLTIDIVSHTTGASNLYKIV